MELVEVQIIRNDEKNDQATADSDAETKNVYDRVIAIPYKISKRNNEVVLYHNDYSIYQSDATYVRFWSSEYYTALKWLIEFRLYQKRYKIMFDIDTESYLCTNF